LRWPETREPGRGGTYRDRNALREDHDSGRVPLREGLSFICRYPNALREDHDSGRVPLREGLLCICMSVCAGLVFEESVSLSCRSARTEQEAE
jgi:hypothetical protein